MSLIFEIDEETLIRILEKKVKMPEDVREKIVSNIAQASSDRIKEKIPVDEGVTEKYWQPSPIRNYVTQSWMTVSFEPKSFGNVGKKGNWRRRTASNTGWGWGWLSMFNRKNRKNYDWYRPEIRKEKQIIQKELKRAVKNYYNNK